MSEPTLLDVLTEQIVKGRISVDAARDIVLRREFFRKTREAHRVAPDSFSDATLEDVEWMRIVEAILKHKGNIEAAALELDISRATVYRKWQRRRTPESERPRRKRSRMYYEMQQAEGR